jgi:uncharacterized alpha/beta hydrolase family protein
LALSFDLDGNTDYVEMDGDRVKDSKAPMIVFGHTMDTGHGNVDKDNILLEIMVQVDQKYNRFITYFKEDAFTNF